MASGTLSTSTASDVQADGLLEQSHVKSAITKKDPYIPEERAPEAESTHDAAIEGTTPHRASVHPLPSPPSILADYKEPSSPNELASGLPNSSSSLQDIPLDPPPPPPVPKSPVATGIHTNDNDIPAASNASLPQPPNSAKSVRTPPPRSTSISSNTSLHHRSLTMHQGNSLSVVLISSALDTIVASREAKKSSALRDSTQRALEMVRAGQGGGQPRDIFEPLKLACETRSEKLMIASLDCISKLISHSFFVESAPAYRQYDSPPNSPGASGNTGGASLDSLPDLVAHTITSAYTETTPDSVSLQIVKALLALVLSPTILIHHSSLLKAVRTVYNVFLLSQDPVNQMVAQGGLTQMVNHVFTRCKIGEALALKTNGHSEYPDSSLSPREFFTRPSSERLQRLALSTPETVPIPPPTPTPQTPNGFKDQSAELEGLEHDQATVVDDPLPLSDPTYNNTNSQENDQALFNQQVDVLNNEVHEDAVEDSKTPPPKNTISLETFEIPNPHDHLSERAHSPLARSLSIKDLFIKDAFLVFRALCKLTMKPLNTESERDMKSHAMRSKLLSLHLVLTILNSHMNIFVEPSSIIYSSSSNESTPFIQATKQYLCLSVSRNAVSLVPQVFELSVEIFWRVLSGLRTKLKPEIEVLLNQIFIPILEMRNSTLKQKAVILEMLFRLCQDPQALVEIYLNYDCDKDAAENIYERLMNVISKMGTSHFSTPKEKTTDPTSPSLHPSNRSTRSTLPPSLSTNALSGPAVPDISGTGLSEGKLKRQSLECLVGVLRSLVVWGTQAGKTVTDPVVNSSTHSHPADDTKLESIPSEMTLDQSGHPSVADASRTATPDINDDPGRFESAKQKKTTLLEGIRKFNFKPKRGIKFLLETGVLPSKAPQDIAMFLMYTDGLSKMMIGEFLGEGEEENIAIMHAFVDLLDFTNLPFTEALRLFLQSFRLPGEAQKIDRFMLKFAERFIGNNPTSFANADAAYVLAYSAILLNTDAFNPQVKNRMTKADFLKNNRGINDGQDLPEEMLSTIFDDITSNEIRMKDEIEAVLISNGPGPGLAGALANVGRDLQKEAYVMQSHSMANKSEALFRTLMKAQRKGAGKGNEQFFSASHFVHVRPMFEVAWMPFLAGISAPLQDTDDLEIVDLCLDGFKSAIRIVCFFDLELERNAFVTTLAKFTFLNNLGEMKTKNMEAIKTLLDVAVNEGNHLKGSWHEVLTCVSQLERMQLISSGIDVPDSGKRGRPRKLLNEDLANESRSTHITVAADMVFSLSHHLSGVAIVDFVQALSDVSWEEIQSSGLSEHPRLFSLQKLVEISYYNMNRIRLEWSNLWAILGEHFNQVCCHNNPHVGFFALDALRQLAMRFLEIEELPHFKFQKDFLKPFEYTMTHNPNPAVRDMVLTCFQQMIQARVYNMRSGWRTMFGVFSAASKVLTEDVVNSAFEIVTRLNRSHFIDIVRYGAFADLTVCITDFSKCSKFQKTSLLAIAMLREVIPTMLEAPECALNGPRDPSAVNTVDDPMIKFWFPILFSFYDIIMNGEDLEVRRLALDSLFSTLKTYGSTYPVNFWDTVCQELLFPIFAVLKSSQDVSRFSTQEDMSVWLSTTMIQALRDLIDLYTYYFEILERFLDGLLDLLCVCICQENDTLARIGTSCFQQLLEKNVRKLSAERWDRIVTTFVRLFKTTTPHQLFDESLRVEIDGSNEPPDTSTDTQTLIPAPLAPPDEEARLAQNGQNVLLSDRRRIFKQIIVKCVLQLLLIETTHELLQNTEVYTTIPPNHLLRLMGELDHSYQFARSFNEDKELRTGLWKVGFMKHLPNLLKQESSSAATLVSVLTRMYKDTRPEGQRSKEQVADRLIPLGLGVLEDFNALRPETQAKTIITWTPVVAEVLQGFDGLDDQTFTRYLPAFYPLTTDILTREMGPELRAAVRSIFLRVGHSCGIIEHQ
ncbi:Sec7-domain-containing protein [Ramaria rubella]|nr:Sec7-domain-containing protein [Ramaria rubella]